MREISNYFSGSCVQRRTSHFLEEHRSILKLACNIDRIWMAFLGARDLSNFYQEGFKGLGFANLNACSFGAGLTITIATLGISKAARNFKASLLNQT